MPLALRRHRIDLLHLPATFSVPVSAPRFVVTAHDLTYKNFFEFLSNPLGRAYCNLMTRLSAARACRIIAMSANTRIIDDAILHAQLKQETRDKTARLKWNAVARRVARDYREAAT